MGSTHARQARSERPDEVVGVFGGREYVLDRIQVQARGQERVQGAAADVCATGLFNEVTVD